jgi:hypothetical protein
MWTRTSVWYQEFDGPYWPNRMEMIHLLVVAPCALRHER